MIMIGVGGIIGFSLFPKADTPNFLITVETPDGSSLRRDQSRHASSSKRVCPRCPMLRVVLHQSSGHGNPKIYGNEFGNEGATNYGDIFVKLEGIRHERHAEEARTTAARAQAVSERAHLCEGVPERSADHGAHRDSRHWAGAWMSWIASRPASSS